MKTKELLAKIIELGFDYEIPELSNSNIQVYLSDYSKKSGNVYMYIRQCEFELGQGWLVSGDTTRALTRYVLDYLDTPTEEREEEKKYRLRIPETFDKEISCYVKKNNAQDYYIGDDTERLDRAQFTQKEIDAMPQSWKDFFIKEEVK